MASSSSLPSPSASRSSSVFSTPSPVGTFTSTASPTTESTNNNTIATSASLYLYTFLATLVLLLSVSAAIVIRSFVLRRRHRLMVEEAIRNGTWVPPAPPIRPPRVDLTKKPVLWEAYIDGKGDLVGHVADDGSKIHDVWRTENSKDWDMIKPFAAAYVTQNAATTTMPDTPTITGLAAIPSVTSLRSTASHPLPTSTAPAPQIDLEAANGAIPPITTATPPTSNGSRTPRHRALLTRALNVLNPTPASTSPLPGLSGSNAGSNVNVTGTNADTGMTELKSPQVMRVAVLIAMPSPPLGAVPGSGSLSASTLSSASSSSTPPPVHPMPTQSQHPLHPSAHPPHSSTLVDDDDEHPLPHLEMGVAEVLVLPSDHAGADSAHSASGLSGKKRAAHRGSVGSVATGMSEGSDM